MSSSISLGLGGWNRLRRGMDILARITASTLGPSGRRILIEQPFTTPKLTSSGYEVARTLELADPVENAGVRLLRQVAWNSKDAVGDGTATAIILAHAMVAAATPAVAAGIDLLTLRRELFQAGERSIAELDRLARPLRGEAELISLASRAAHDGASIGPAVARAVYALKRDGVVLVEESDGREDTLVMQRGLHFAGGYLSSHFATDAGGLIAVLDDPYLLIVAERITSLEAIVPALNAFAGAGKALVVIAEDVSSDALATLVVNKQQANCRIVAAKTPGFGRWRRPLLEDIAIATGGTVVAADRGDTLARLRPDMLGRARQVRVELSATTIVEGAGATDAIEQRCQELRREIAGARHLSFDREMYQERLARLTSGVARYRVAGATSTERADRMDAARAAVGAARAAFDEGVVPGSGSALLYAAQEASRATPATVEQRAAAAILRGALAAPARCIATNVGTEGPRIVAELIGGCNASLVFDAVTGDIVDAWDTGLLDPVSVVRTALRSALSLAVGLIGSGGAIVAAPETKVPSRA